MSGNGHRRARGAEDGASAVEFAIIVPLFFMMIMGMITGGIAFNRKLAMAHASREGARHGATLPTGTGAIPGQWFESVGNRAILSAAGELDSTVPDQYVCVAYIGFGSPQQSSADRTSRRIMTAGSWGPVEAGSKDDRATWCFDDSRGPDGNERRVQVEVRRTTEFNALLFANTLTITSQAVARFEAVAPA